MGLTGFFSRETSLKLKGNKKNIKETEIMILGRGVIMLYVLWVAEILLKLMIDFSLSSRVNDAFSLRRCRILATNLGLGCDGLFIMGIVSAMLTREEKVAGFFGTHQKLSSLQRS